MTSTNIEDVTAALQKTQVSLSGVSFQGKSLKLNTAADAKEVVDAIEKCSCLQYLNLEGNTLGVDAAEVIAKAIEKHPEFKHALWKDMFTGRMKTEIPLALQHLGKGLVAADARLTELDLSDNAFGPIGVQGLAALLRSASCYALQELRLNNNGLGVTGAGLLASALTDCYNSSKAEGKPLALKVFVAGRNRLENEGAIAMAAVFKTIGTLEEITIPQNGIYHVGVAALSDAFTHNKNLRILNLNDNTVTPKGCKALAAALPSLSKLQVINFGDCLLKTEGAICLAEALTDGQSDLEELLIDHNEIGSESVDALIKAIQKKVKLKHLMADGNNFGHKGVETLKKKVREIGLANVLDTLSEDESMDEKDEDGDEDTDEESAEEGDGTFKQDENDASVTEQPVQYQQISTVAEFVKVPTWENFMALGDSRCDLLIKEIKGYSTDSYIEGSVTLIMKVSSLSINNQAEVANAALQCSNALYKELFSRVQASKEYSLLNNSLLVHLGLIKGEDKKYKPLWNVEGCLTALEHTVKSNSIPEEIRVTLKAFMDKSCKLNDSCIQIMKNILKNLH